MSNNIPSLPVFEHINSDIGLKYLNGNINLYITILNNFLQRYKDLELIKLKEDELNSNIHTIKGLSSTLGMMNLAKITTKIQNEINPSIGLIDECSKILKNNIEELSRFFSLMNNNEISNILIINNEPNEIDELMELLDDNFDILLALNRYEALEIFEEERVDLVILHTEVNDLCGLSIFRFLQRHTNIEHIPIIFITKEENQSEIEDIYSQQKISFIYRPFQREELMKQIKIFNNS